MIQGYDINSINVDDEKKVAITTTEGPLLIIAGPGSGKTKTLVERIVYLISKGVSPEEIFVATFTEKAAKELITRISNRLLELGLQINLNEMYVGTLHSIFLRILEDYRDCTRLKRSYRLLDQFDQKYLLFRNMKNFTSISDSEELLGDHHIGRWSKADKLLKLLNLVGEEFLDVAQLKVDEDRRIQVLGEFYDEYEALLDIENALDFSSIQSEAYLLLKNSPTVLAELQAKLKYFMVDEYQDTNTIQEKILLLLASKENNLCVVGDDDQGLYRFRGATIRNILEFEKNFGSGVCQRVTLTTNYRSHPDIIQFYNEWMEQMEWTEGGVQFRFDKVIKPREDEFSCNPSVVKLSSPGSLESYYEEIVQFILEAERVGVLKNRNQIAFLFRSVKNEKVIGLANYLEKNGIHVFSPRSAQFFDRKEIRLLIGAIVFVFPKLFDQLKWKESVELGVWSYYEDCKREFAEEVRSDKEKHKSLLMWVQIRAKQHLTLEESTNYGFAALIYQLLEYPMFSEYLDRPLTSGQVDLRPSYNIALLTKLLYKFEFLNNVTIITRQNIEILLRSLFNQFLRFVHQGGIEEYEDFDEVAPSGCVSFMTIHQSKGLEFPIVFAGLPNNRQGPRSQVTEIEELLQERHYHKPLFEPYSHIPSFDYWRLYYTAFSRAQNLLILGAHEQTNKDGGYSSPQAAFIPQYLKTINWKDSGFQLKELELETIGKANVKSEYSFTSHILLYENCPQQYKFYKEMEFTEVRTGGVLAGQLLHQTIEDIHKAVIQNQSADLSDGVIENWFQTNYHLLSKQQRSYLHRPQQDSLLEQVKKYRDKNANDWDKIVAAEVDVSLVKEDYILKGSIDLIKGSEGTVELIDFKSGDKPDVNSTDDLTVETLARYRRQLEVYAHLVEQKTGYKVSKMHLHYPKEENSSPYITFPKDDTTVENTIKTFEKVVQKIENKNFDNSHITKSDKQCGNCDMRFYCKKR